MSKLLILAACGLLLTGCASMDELSRQECAELGLKPGAPEYPACWQRAMARRQGIINSIIESQ